MKHELTCRIQQELQKMSDSMGDLVKLLDALDDKAPLEEFKTVFSKCEETAKTWNELQKTCSSRTSEAKKRSSTDSGTGEQKSKRPKPKKTVQTDDDDDHLAGDDE
jgi:hypothetical protein